MMSRRMLAAAAGLALALPALPAAAQPRDTLRVVAQFEVGGIDPLQTGYLFTRLEVLETLVTTDRDNRLVPLLAERWGVSEDGLTWRFILRQGVTFHDGSPLTAEAVVASLARSRQAPGVLATVPVAAIGADPGAVTIRTTRPFASLPAFLANYTAAILAPGAFAPDGSVRSVIGTGPYRIVSIAAPQGVETARFDGWRGARPDVAGVRYLAAGRGETRTLMAESGEADLVFNLPPISFERLRRSTRVALTTLPIPRTYVLKVNAGGAAFSDVRTRRALSLALDREGIAAGILRTPQAAATQLMPPAMEGWHDPALPKLAHDPAAARRLLAEAGWRPGPDGVLARDGVKLNVTLRTFPDRPEQPVMAAAMQAQLKEIGIAVEVSVTSSAEIPAGHRDGTLDLALFARNFSLVPDPLGTFLSDYGAEGGDWGAMGWRNAELPQVLLQLSGTFDADRALPLRRRVAGILQDELSVVPVAWFTHSVAANRRIGDVSLDPYELSFRISEMRLAR